MTELQIIRKPDGNSTFLRWAEAHQRHRGASEKVIKEFKFRLRKSSSDFRSKAKADLKFAKTQQRLIERPY